MSDQHALFQCRYMDRSKLRGDSTRFRNRVSAAFDLADTLKFEFAKVLKAEGGIVVPHGRNGHMWNAFWQDGTLEEVLSAITLAVQRVRRVDQHWSAGFRDAVRRAMQDEYLGLRIDDLGVVHLGVDEDFELVRLATLAGLDDRRLGHARSFYEAAHGHLDAHPMDTLAAVRAAFDSVEVLANQLVPTHQNLHAGLCRGELKKVCLSVLTADKTEAITLGYVFDGMAEWVTGFHYYRHPKSTVPFPSLQTAIIGVSTASAYVRLLAGVASTVLPQT